MPQPTRSVPVIPTSDLHAIFSQPRFENPLTDDELDQLWDEMAEARAEHHRRNDPNQWRLALNLIIAGFGVYAVLAGLFLVFVS